MNEFKAEKSNKECPKFGSKMQIFDAAPHTERGINLPKFAQQKQQTGEGGVTRQCLTNKLSKSFPAKNDGRGNEITM